MAGEPVTGSTTSVGQRDAAQPVIR
jgi:hypothetical protein